MSKQVIPTLAQRLLHMDDMLRRLNVTLVHVDDMHTDLLKKLSTLAEVQGFNVTIRPLFEKDTAMTILWELKKRREGIAPAETREVEIAMSNIVAVGFKKGAVQYETHSILVHFKMR